MDSNTPLSRSAIRDLERTWSAAPKTSFRQWSKCAAALENQRAWCRRALAGNHLVAVASHLHRKHGVRFEDFETLGLPSDILQQFPHWRAGSRAGFRPRRSGLKSAGSGAAVPIQRIRIQLSPAAMTTPYALVLLRDLLVRMDPAVGFTVVVEPGANKEGLREVVGDFHDGAEHRVRFVELPSLTVFAQDNALAARDDAGKPVLLIPRAFGSGWDRAADALSVEDAQRVFEMPVVRSQLHWEGGNIVHGSDHCFVGIDTIIENTCRLGLTRGEVIEMFTAELGVDVLTLGDPALVRFDPHAGRLVKSGQAAFHVDLDVSLLGDIGSRRMPVALIADPARGLDLLPAVLARRSLFANHFLAADRARNVIETAYNSYAGERHPKLLGYCTALEKSGYRVVGLPDLRINPEDNLFRPINLDFSYCNVLPGLRRRRPSVHYLPWGIRRLDEDAERRMRFAGVDPVRVSSPRIANLLMSLAGGLHCFCGPL